VLPSIGMVQSSEPTKRLIHGTPRIGSLRTRCSTRNTNIPDKRECLLYLQAGLAITPPLRNPDPVPFHRNHIGYFIFRSLFVFPMMYRTCSATTAILSLQYQQVTCSAIIEDEGRNELILTNVLPCFLFCSPYDTRAAQEQS